MGYLLKVTVRAQTIAPLSFSHRDASNTFQSWLAYTNTLPNAHLLRAHSLLLRSGCPTMQRRWPLSLSSHPSLASGAGRRRASPRR